MIAGFKIINMILESYKKYQVSIFDHLNSN